MISYQDALQQVLANIQPLPAVTVPLEQAHGLVLAEAIVARWDMPPADNSAMDGFAFAWNDPAAGTELAIVGSAFAGSPWSGALGPGEAVRIMTGSPLPAGCDTVVPLEDAIATGTTIRLPDQLKKGQHVRWRGEEFRDGERLLESGTRLHAGEIGLLAAAGISRVRAHPKPRVALLATGDELVELGRMPGPGQIVNSNTYLLSAMLREAGCEVLPLGLCCDDPQALAQRLDEGKAADLLLTTGGVSVGDRDHLRDVLAVKGFDTVFWKVAIKPGKPVLFGLLQSRPVFGLPGNPAAAAATFALFVRPALRRLAGHLSVANATRKGRLTEAVTGGGGDRRLFLWCRVEWSGEHYLVHVPRRQGSGQARSLQGANALLAMPVGVAGLAAGKEVEVQLLSS